MFVFWKEKMFKRYLNYMAIFYLLAVLFLFYMIDAEKACRRRIDALLGFSTYPVLLNGDQVVYDKGKLRAALSYYKKERIFQPLHWQSRSDEMAGHCYFWLKEYSRSKQMYQRALKYAPNNFWLYFNLGSIAIQQGRCKEASDYFKKIANGDTGQQLDWAVMAPLKGLKEPVYQKYLASIPVFVNELRQKSLALLLYEDSCEGIEAVSRLAKPVIHPLSFVVYPGEEVFADPR